MAIDTLLPVGGAILGGTMGVVGGLPGVIAGATIGGAGGEAWRQNIQRLRGKQSPETAAEAATAIGTTGAVEGGLAAIGGGGARLIRGVSRIPIVQDVVKGIAKNIPGARMVRGVIQERATRRAAQPSKMAAGYERYLPNVSGAKPAKATVMTEGEIVPKRLALSSGKPPIVTPSPADPSGAWPVRARPVIVRDPQTGRMKRMYSSDPDAPLTPQFQEAGRSRVSPAAERQLLQELAQELPSSWQQFLKPEGWKPRIGKHGRMMMKQDVTDPSVEIINTPGRVPGKVSLREVMDSIISKKQAKRR